MPSVEEFEAAGLYDPAVDANLGRLELLEWLDGQGFTIAEMLHAHQVVTVGLVSLATDRRMLGGELLTRRAAIELSGLSPDDFDATATAVGFVPVAAAPDSEIGFTAADAMMIAALGFFTSIYSRNEALAVVRVMGSSVARIAEAAVSLYLQDIESPHVKAGGSELIQAQQSYERVGVFDTGTGEHLNSMLRRHTMQAVERTRRAATGFEERFDYRYAVGFVDLVGFTAISAEMSPQKLGEFVRDFESRAHNAVTNVGARVVKFIGDEVMFVSPDADAACRAANALVSSFASANENIVPRGGLAYGNVLLRGGDYFGSVVNLASRLVDEAVPRELLVTGDLALAATQCEFESAGRRMVKGFANPISVSSFLTG